MLDTILEFTIQAYHNGSLFWGILGLILGLVFGIFIGYVWAMKSKRYKLMVEKAKLEMAMVRQREKERREIFLRNMSLAESYSSNPFVP